MTEGDLVHGWRFSLKGSPRFYDDVVRIIATSENAEVYFGEALTYERGAAVALWRVRAAEFDWLPALYSWWADQQRIEPVRTTFHLYFPPDLNYAALNLRAHSPADVADAIRRKAPPTSWTRRPRQTSQEVSMPEAHSKEPYAPVKPSADKPSLNIDERLKLGFTLTNDVIKQFLTLSTAVLTLTIALQRDIIKTNAESVRSIMMWSWIFYLISIVTGTLAMMTLAAASLDKGASTADADIRFWGYLQVIAFIIATILVAKFGVDTIRSPTPAP